MLADSLLLSELSSISYVLFVQSKNIWASFSGLSELHLSSLVPVPYSTFLVIPITRHKIAGLRF